MSEWRSVTLGELCSEAGGNIQTGPFGSQLHAADYVLDGTPVVMPQDIDDNHLVVDDIARIPEGDVQRLSKHRLAAGDIVYSRRGDVERRALVREENVGWLCGTGCLRVRIGDPAIHDSRFISYALGLSEVRSWIVRHAVGATMLNLNTAILSSVPLQVPLVELQRSLVEVLVALDDKIAANEQVISSTWALARASFLRDASGVDSVATTLGEASARGWLRLGDGYRTRGSEYGFPGLRILRAGDLEIDRIAATGKDYVSHGYLKPIGAKASQAGDVVVTTKGTVGRVAVVPSGSEQFVYSPQLCFFRVLDADQVDRGFLSGWFRSKNFQVQAETRMFKSDMAPYINLDDIRSMMVSVPRSMEDQRRIGSVQTELEQLAHSKDGENLVLASTRDELLPLLMSGKLRVKDAEKVVEEVT